MPKTHFFFHIPVFVHGTAGFMHLYTALLANQIH